MRAKVLRAQFWIDQRELQLTNCRYCNGNEPNLRAQDIDIDTIGYHCSADECERRAHSQISFSVCCRRPFNPYNNTSFLGSDPALSEDDLQGSIDYGSENNASEQNEEEFDEEGEEEQ